MQNEKIDIYILVSQTGTVFSRILRFVTKAPYNHVSIALDKDLNQMYSFARRKIKRPWIAGLIQEHPSEGMFFIKQETNCRVYQKEITLEQYEKILKQIDLFMDDYEMYRYNFLGLPFIWFGIPIERKKHYVCSQFVAYLLQKADICFQQTHYSLIKPDDFCHQEGFVLVYEGRLQEYELNYA